ncbi:MAG: WD40/YVTN/BNR-like repeat-containing protein, partial [Gemmatimonadaceae bacterium]
MRNRLTFLLAAASLAAPAIAQQRPAAARQAGQVVPITLDPAVATSALRYRYIGPVGNRVSAVVGIPGDPNVYYAGAASGGIFKTTDGGINWQSIFDDHEVSSIGALAVARSDANIVWAGTGEPHIRSHVSIGNGIYKSTDAGRTWRRMGLEESGRISRILIHPSNPDVVYAGVQGHGYGPQQQRGLFRTRNGGQSWERVLFVDENTGVSDMVMDPADPNKIFVGMWQLLSRTWGRESGGPGSGLYLTRDGGNTFNKLQGNGLPIHTIGKIGLGLAHSNPNRVYALIETGDGIPYKGQPTDNGELWRSDDGGNTWKVVSYDRNLACRQPYYTRMAVSTDNPDEAYFMCATFSRTLDGGLTNRGGQGGGGGGGFGGAQQQAGPPLSTPGGDQHDMWIDPTNANRMINGNDQNVAVSTTRARTWLRTNLPIAQMYHVTTDNRVPYYVYGNRQDGPSYRVPSNSRTGGLIPRSETHGIMGGESGFATPDPVDTNIIWSTASGSGSRGGIVVRFDQRNRHSQNVEVYPLSTGGHPAANLKYRFIWNAPFLISPHDHNRVYTGSQHVHVSTNGGRSWREISPDLTRNDKSKQQISGGLTPDNIGVEYGGTLMAISESRRQRGVIWTGSNDGKVHVTRDSGGTWTDVSPPLPTAASWGSVKHVEPSRFDAASAYVTVDAHQEGNFEPWVYRTKDFGKTWDLIITGIKPSPVSWANVIIQDPIRRGLLYLGTENSLYISYNDGDNWVRFNNNLPPAPVYGLTIQEHFNDLAVGTYGRGFYILDDLSPLRRLAAGGTPKEAELFPPRQAYRFRGVEMPFTQFYDAVNGFNPT